VRGVLAIAAALPGCLLAPDRPSGASGDPIAVAPSGCLPPGTQLQTSAVGELPDGHAALFRADGTGAAPRIYAFEPTRSASGCYTLAVPLPVAPGAHVLALDVTPRDTHSVITALVEDNHQLAIAEVELDGTSTAVGSAISSMLTIDPDVVASSDDTPTRPRFIHRMPLSGDLWFGGGTRIGVVAQASPGQLGAPVFRDVAATPAQAWLEAFPLATPQNGDTAVLVGEAITCAAHEVTAAGQVACLQAPAIRATPCAQNSCPERDEHVLRDAPGYVGFSDIQLGDQTVDVELVMSNLTHDEPALAPPTDGIWAVDMAIAARLDNDLDAAVLWFDLPLTTGKLALYRGVANSTRVPTATTRPVSANAEAVFEGAFSTTGRAFLVVGPTSDEVTCFADDPTLAACQ